jgi:hypothetical protein
MSVFHGASAHLGGMTTGSFAQTHAGGGLSSWEDSSQTHNQTRDAIETYFECITTCSLEDGECVTRCVEQLRET